MSLNEAALSHICNRSKSGANPTAHLPKGFKEALRVQRILCSASVVTRLLLLLLKTAAAQSLAAAAAAAAAAAGDVRHDDFPVDALRSFISHRSDDNRKKKTQSEIVSKQPSRACKTTP
jgi:hypothetical protein